MEQAEEFIPLTHWAKYHTHPTVHGMKQRYRHREKNGYKTAFFKEGNRIIIKKYEFWKCFKRIGEKK